MCACACVCVRIEYIECIEVIVVALVVIVFPLRFVSNCAIAHLTVVYIKGFNDIINNNNSVILKK